MGATALIVVSAFLHALWNALLKKERDVRAATLGVVAVAAGVSALVALVSGPGHFPSRAALVFAVASGAFEGAYFLALGESFEQLPMGLAYAVSRGVAMLLVWAISTVFFGEVLNVFAAAGVACVAAGLGLTNDQGSSGMLGRRRGQIDFGGLVRLRWPLLCAVSIAGYHFFYRAALLEKARPSALFALSLWVGIPLLILLGKRGTAVAATRLALRRPLAIGLAGVLCAGAFLVFLEGLSRSGAGFAITLRNTSVIFAQGFAALLGERISVRRLAGTGLIAVGALLLAGH